MSCHFYMQAEATFKVIFTASLVSSIPYDNTALMHYENMSMLYREIYLAVKMKIFC